MLKKIVIVIVIHDYIYFGNVINYDYDYLAFLTNVIEYDYSKKFDNYNIRIIECDYSISAL